MTSKRLVQGTLSSIGIGAVASGIGFIMQDGVTELIRGLVLVLIGAGIVFWREQRKEVSPNEGDLQ
jgi:hypothetical protein